MNFKPLECSASPMHVVGALWGQLLLFLVSSSISSLRNSRRSTTKPWSSLRSRNSCSYFLCPHGGRISVSSSSSVLFGVKNLFYLASISGIISQYPAKISNLTLDIPSYNANICSLIPIHNCNGFGGIFNSI